jgi:peptidyl-prolyl cis-trans isomerase A (cyclophilin A)
MKTQLLFALVAAAFGCHKQAEDVPKPVQNSGGDMKPEPVAKETPAQPSPDPAPAAGLVRAPTAADLDEYVGKLPGSGTKVFAQIDTNQGTIHCELFTTKAPMTVANFIGLATGMKPWLDPKSNEVQKKKPYFDGLTFHRVIAGFMIQGGDPIGNGTGGPGYTFANEIAHDLTMDPGALAMANAGPDTNGSQFFIMEGSKPGLIGGYSIFGQCKDPDVVKKITSVKTDPNDRPETPVTIDKITITKG